MHGGTQSFSVMKMKGETEVLREKYVLPHGEASQYHKCDMD